MVFVGEVDAVDADRLAQVFGLSGIVKELKDRYNIASRQLIVALAEDETGVVTL